MSADPLPPALVRLIGQHPAALRFVRWGNAGELGDVHLEIETKHGQVVLIHPPSGAVYADPPLPPGTDPDTRRTQQDLTAEASVAFDERPVISTVTPVPGPSGHGAWRFTLSTGAVLALTSTGSIEASSGAQPGAVS